MVIDYSLRRCDISQELFERMNPVAKWWLNWKEEFIKQQEQKYGGEIPKCYEKKGEVRNMCI